METNVANGRFDEGSSAEGARTGEWADTPIAPMLTPYLGKTVADAVVKLNFSSVFEVERIDEKAFVDRYHDALGANATLVHRLCVDFANQINHLRFRDRKLGIDERNDVLSDAALARDGGAIGTTARLTASQPSARAPVDGPSERSASLLQPMSATVMSVDANDMAVRALASDAPTMTLARLANLDTQPGCQPDAMEASHSPLAYAATMRKEIFLMEQEPIPEGQHRLHFTDRRPDLDDVRLDAKSAYGTVPTIDIVNHVLVDFITRGHANATKDFDIWRSMAERVFPIRFPYNHPYAKIALCFDHIGANLGEAARIVSDAFPEFLSVGTHDEALERLGLGGLDPWVAYSNVAPEQLRALQDLRDSFGHAGALFSLDIEIDKSENIDCWCPKPVAGTNLFFDAQAPGGGELQILMTCVVLDYEGSVDKCGVQFETDPSNNKHTEMFQKVPPSAFSRLPMKAGKSPKSVFFGKFSTSVSRSTLLNNGQQKKLITNFIYEIFTLTAAAQTVGSHSVKTLGSHAVNCNITVVPADSVEYGPARAALESAALSTHFGTGGDLRNAGTLKAALDVSNDEIDEIFCLGKFKLHPSMHYSAPTPALPFLNIKEREDGDLQEVVRDQNDPRQFQNLTASRLANINSLVRLRRWTGVPYRTLHQLLSVTLGPHAPATWGVSSRQVRTIGAYRYFVKQYEVDPQTFCALIGDIDSWSEDGKSSLLDKLFGRTGGTANLDVDGAPFDFAATEDPRIARLQKALQVTGSKFLKIARLISRNMSSGESNAQASVLPFSIGVISAFYRLAMLDRILRFDFSDGPGVLAAMGDRLWDDQNAVCRAFINLSGSAQPDMTALDSLIKVESVVALSKSLNFDEGLKKFLALAKPDGLPADALDALLKLAKRIQASSASVNGDHINVMARLITDVYLGDSDKYSPNAAMAVIQVVGREVVGVFEACAGLNAASELKDLTPAQIEILLPYYQCFMLLNEIEYFSMGLSGLESADFCGRMKIRPPRAIAVLSLELAFELKRYTVLVKRIADSSHREPALTTAEAEIALLDYLAHAEGQTALDIARLFGADLTTVQDVLAGSGLKANTVDALSTLLATVDKSSEWHVDARSLLKVATLPSMGFTELEALADALVVALDH